MALTDPELDLLRELLEDDPTDEAFLQVGEELVRRALWSEAQAVLMAGLDAHADALRGWSLLARAALECDQPEVALAALARVDCAPESDRSNAQLQILALERAGQHDEAKARIDAFLAFDPDDVVVNAALERLATPPPVTGTRASDPFVSVEQAERYVAVGRPDRAVRFYRRILFHNPGDASLLNRLRQLAVDPFDHPADDLSEELTDPGATPPDLHMPVPRLSVSPTEPGPPRREAKPGPPRGEEPPQDVDPDDEDTDLHVIGPDGRLLRATTKRRRRSLLQRD